MSKYYCLYLLTVYGLASGAAQSSSGGCVLPGYPPHGTYTVYNKPEAVPGQVYDFAGLTVSCDPGYGVVGCGSNMTYCFGGNFWQQPMPQCIRFCRLTPDPSVNYYCKLIGDGVVGGTRLCHELEPHGTEVVPECNRPFYYSSSVLLNMRCVDGTWDHVAVCQPDCGTPTPVADRLIINGNRTKHGELPWHAGVYDKTFTPYKQICGGSLISTRVIISAAHCFWKTGRQQAASTYAVALGKIYRPWNETMDSEAHKSDVSEIRIPFRYLGDAGHYQEDIALVFLSTPVVYRTYIRPVCIDFSEEFDRHQLQSKNLGKVSGWGLTAADGPPSPLLLTTDLPYVNTTKCMAELPSEFKPYLNSDKFCAGNKDGTTVCRGDSGGGLVFPSEDRGIRRYYLRGVVSTAPHSDQKCNVNSYTTFTHIQFHATFIRDYGLAVVSGRAENDIKETLSPDYDEMKRRVVPSGCYMEPANSSVCCHINDPVWKIEELRTYFRGTQEETLQGAGMTCWYNDEKPAMCCRSTRDVPLPPEPSQCPPFAPLPSQPNDIAFEKCLEYQRYVSLCVADETDDGKFVRQDSCGIKQVSEGSEDSLVQRSLPAGPNEFPHMALLGYWNDTNPGTAPVQWIASGSLISEKFILTSARVLVDPDYGRIRYALLGVTNKTATRDGIMYSVANTIAYNLYVRNQKQHDIALVELDRRVQFNEFIRPACLPSPGLEVVGMTRTMASWRRNEEVLTKNYFAEMDRTRCWNHFDPFVPIWRDDMLCVGDTIGTSGRNAVSGAPLMALARNLPCTYIVRGVFAVPLPYSYMMETSLYTNVTAYLPWIIQNVWTK